MLQCSHISYANRERRPQALRARLTGTHGGNIQDVLSQAEAKADSWDVWPRWADGQARCAMPRSHNRGHSVSVTRPEVGHGKPQASHAPDRHEPHNAPAPPLDPPPFCLLQRVQYSTFRRAQGLGRSSMSRSSRSRQSLRPRASARRITPQSVSCFARRSGSREPTAASRKRSQR